MSDDWVNAKTLQVIAEYSLMHDLVTLDGVAYVCDERYRPYYEDNGARLERERIINILVSMRETTHKDAWDTLDDAIDAIKGVTPDYLSEEPAPESKETTSTPFEYEGWN